MQGPFTCATPNVSRTLAPLTTCYDEIKSPLISENHGSSQRGRSGRMRRLEQNLPTNLARKPLLPAKPQLLGP